MADVISDAVKLAVHEGDFTFGDVGTSVNAQIGTLGAWVPDVGDLTLTAITSAGWTSLADSSVTGKTVGLDSPDVVWNCTDILFDTTGLGTTPFDGIVLYDFDTDMFIFFYDLADVIPGDSTLIAPHANGLARF